MGGCFSTLAGFITDSDLEHLVDSGRLDLRSLVVKTLARETQSFCIGRLFPADQNTFLLQRKVVKVGKRWQAPVVTLGCEEDNKEWTE